jgi:hypothetical protein
VVVTGLATESVRMTLPWRSWETVITGAAMEGIASRLER